MNGHYHCAQAEQYGGCNCAVIYESGLDLMALDGTGYTVRFVAEPHELIRLDEFPCAGRALHPELECSFTVHRAPNALRLFITHAPGYGMSWRLMTSPKSTEQQAARWWRPWLEQMAPIIHAGMLDCSTDVEGLTR